MCIHTLLFRSGRTLRSARLRGSRPDARASDFRGEPARVLLLYILTMSMIMCMLMCNNILHCAPILYDREYYHNVI